MENRTTSKSGGVRKSFPASTDSDNTASAAGAAASNQSEKSSSNSPFVPLAPIPKQNMTTAATKHANNHLALPPRATNSSILQPSAHVGAENRVNTLAQPLAKEQQQERDSYNKLERENKELKAMMGVAAVMHINAVNKLKEEFAMKEAMWNSKNQASMIETLKAHEPASAASASNANAAATDVTVSAGAAYSIPVFGIQPSSNAAAAISSASNGDAHETSIPITTVPSSLIHRLQEVLLSYKKAESAASANYKLLKGMNRFFEEELETVLNPSTNSTDAALVTPIASAPMPTAINGLTHATQSPSKSTSTLLPAKRRSDANQTPVNDDAQHANSDAQADPSMTTPLKKMRTEANTPTTSSGKANAESRSGSKSGSERRSKPVNHTVAPSAAASKGTPTSTSLDLPTNQSTAMDIDQVSAPTASSAAKRKPEFARRTGGAPSNSAALPVAPADDEDLVADGGNSGGMEEDEQEPHRNEVEKENTIQPEEDAGATRRTSDRESAVALRIAVESDIAENGRRRKERTDLAASKKQKKSSKVRSESSSQRVNASEAVNLVSDDSDDEALPRPTTSGRSALANTNKRDSAGESSKQRQSVTQPQDSTSAASHKPSQLPKRQTSVSRDARDEMAEESSESKKKKKSTASQPRAKSRHLVSNSDTEDEDITSLLNAPDVTPKKPLPSQSDLNLTQSQQSVDTAARTQERMAHSPHIVSQLSSHTRPVTNVRMGGNTARQLPSAPAFNEEPTRRSSSSLKENSKQASAARASDPVAPSIARKTSTSSKDDVAGKAKKPTTLKESSQPVSTTSSRPSRAAKAKVKGYREKYDDEGVLLPGEDEDDYASDSDDDNEESAADEDDEDGASASHNKKHSTTSSQRSVKKKAESKKSEKQQDATACAPSASHRPSVPAAARVQRQRSTTSTASADEDDHKSSTNPASTDSLASCPRCSMEIPHSNRRLVCAQCDKEFCFDCYVYERGSDEKHQPGHAIKKMHR